MDQLARDKKIDPAAIEVWFGDEARFGQKNKITRRWARRGTRPSAPRDLRTASAYTFGSRAHSKRPDSKGSSPARLTSDSPCLLDEEASSHGEDLVGRSAGPGYCVEGGLSRNAAAARFGIAVATAVRWLRAWRVTGATAAKRKGGDLRSHRIEAYREVILGAIEAQVDVTLVELADLLKREHGASFAPSTIWRFLDRHGMTLKK